MNSSTSISNAKLEANRRNAQLSTGPRTAAGLAVSSRNALRHGLSSMTLTVLPTENPDELKTLAETICSEWNPTGDAETFFIDQMICARWRLARIQRLEAEAFDRLFETGGMSEQNEPNLDREILAELERPSNLLDKLERYSRAAERAYSKALKDLQQLRAANAKTTRQNKAKEAEIWYYTELEKFRRSQHRGVSDPFGEEGLPCNSEPFRPIQHQASLAAAASSATFA
jgi:hypothetical protein